VFTRLTPPIEITDCPPWTAVIKPGAQILVSISYYMPDLVRVYGRQSTTIFPAGFVQVGGYGLGAAGNYSVTITQVGLYGRYVLTLDCP
jgi:hypothetical protein